jgi:hypothetical protein
MMDFSSATDAELSVFAYPYDWSEVAVMADTTKYLTKDSATAPMMLNGLTATTFNADKKIVSSSDYYYYMGAPYGTDLTYRTYDAQGNITQMFFLSDSGMGPDSVSRMVFYYNAQGRLDRDSLFEYDNGQWVPMGLLSYAYDGAGNITSLTLDGAFMTTNWTTMSQYVNTFYNDNKLKTSTSYEFNGSALEATAKDSLGYGSNSPMVTYHASYEWYNNIWEPVYRVTKHMNAQGLPDTVTTSFYDSPLSTWLDFQRAVYSYTAYGNPEQGKEYFSDATSWSLNRIYNFYYEIYNDLNSVSNVPALQEMTVYPNPATSEINIRWKEGNGKKVTMEMVNAAGQQMMSAAINWKSDSQVIPVQALTPGMYWLTVRNEAGAVIFRQAVVKQ